MSASNKMVIVLSRGLDDERASVAWSIANSGVASGFEVLMFLVSAGVDWARKGAADVAHPVPTDPSIGEMMRTFVSGGGTIQACPPCMKVRGYSEENIVAGVKVAGAPAMLEWVKEGAEVISL